MVEIEVVLALPDTGVKALGLTLARNPIEDKIFIKSFYRGEDEKPGLLESQGVVAVGDCLAAINGVLVDQTDLSATTNTLRSSAFPLKLLFTRPRSVITTKTGGNNADLDALINSRVMLRIGERVAKVQHNNTQLVAKVNQVMTSVATKRDEVEQMAFSVAALKEAADWLPDTRQTLKSLHKDVALLCKAMAHIDTLLSLKELEAEAIKS